MASKPETNFRKKVKEDLATLTNLHVFPIQQVAIVGTPDFLVCAGGIFIGLEIKAEDGVTSPKQDYELGCLTDTGGYGFVARPSTWDEVFGQIKDIMNNNFQRRQYYLHELAPKKQARRKKAE